MPKIPGWTWLLGGVGVVAFLAHRANQPAAVSDTAALDAHVSTDTADGSTLPAASAPHVSLDTTPNPPSGSAAAPFTPPTLPLTLPLTQQLTQSIISILTPAMTQTNDGKTIPVAITPTGLVTISVPKPVVSSKPLVTSALVSALRSNLVAGKPAIKPATTLKITKGLGNFVVVRR